jgi:hypothetical protein
MGHRLPWVYKKSSVYFLLLVDERVVQAYFCEKFVHAIYKLIRILGHFNILHGLHQIFCVLLLFLTNFFLILVRQLEHFRKVFIHLLPRIVSEKIGFRFVLRVFVRVGSMIRRRIVELFEIFGIINDLNLLFETFWILYFIFVHKGIIFLQLRILTRRSYTGNLWSKSWRFCTSQIRWC